MDSMLWNHWFWITCIIFSEVCLVAVEPKSAHQISLDLNVSSRDRREERLKFTSSLHPPHHSEARTDLDPAGPNEARPGGGGRPSRAREDQLRPINLQTRVGQIQLINIYESNSDRSQGADTSGPGGGGNIGTEGSAHVIQSTERGAEFDFSKTETFANEPGSFQREAESSIKEGVQSEKERVPQVKNQFPGETKDSSSELFGSQLDRTRVQESSPMELLSSSKETDNFQRWPEPFQTELNISQGEPESTQKIPKSLQSERESPESLPKGSESSREGKSIVQVPLLIQVKPGDISIIFPSRHSTQHTRDSSLKDWSSVPKNIPVPMVSGSFTPRWFLSSVPPQVYSTSTQSPLSENRVYSTSTQSPLSENRVYSISTQSPLAENRVYSASTQSLLVENRVYSASTQSPLVENRVYSASTQSSLVENTMTSSRSSAGSSEPHRVNPNSSKLSSSSSEETVGPNPWVYHKPSRAPGPLNPWVFSKSTPAPVESNLRVFSTPPPREYKPNGSTTPEPLEEEESYANYLDPSDTNIIPKNNKRSDQLFPRNTDRISGETNQNQRNNGTQQDTLQQEDINTKDVGLGAVDNPVPSVVDDPVVDEHVIFTNDDQIGEADDDHVLRDEEEPSEVNDASLVLVDGFRSLRNSSLSRPDLIDSDTGLDGNQDLVSASEDSQYILEEPQGPQGPQEPQVQVQEPRSRQNRIDRGFTQLDPPSESQPWDLGGRSEQAEVGRSINLEAGGEDRVFLSQHVITNDLPVEGSGEGRITVEIERRTRTRVLDISNMVGIALGLLVFLLLLTGAAGALMYRRQYQGKRQGERFSNFDSSSFADSDTFNTISYADCAGIEIQKDNSSEELYSLDNDSFLNSLEAMTFPEPWVTRHTNL